MKNFISENWFKLMIGSSLLMASFGFMVQSINPLKAGDGNNLMINTNYRMIPVNDDGTINVRLTDEQIDKIIPKNEDGSLKIKFSPSAVMDVNLVKINGVTPAFVRSTSDNAVLKVYTDN